MGSQGVSILGSSEFDFICLCFVLYVCVLGCLGVLGNDLRSVLRKRGKASETYLKRLECICMRSKCARMLINAQKCLESPKTSRNCLERTHNAHDNVKCVRTSEQLAPSTKNRARSKPRPQNAPERSARTTRPFPEHLRSFRLFS